MSKKFDCSVFLSGLVLAGALGLSPAAAKDLKFPDYKAYDQATPRLDTSWAGPWSRPLDLYGGVQAGLNWSDASFNNVDPVFTIDGVTGVGGLYGGIRGRPSETDVGFGFRAGVLWDFGSNSISHPVASPFLDYRYRNNWTVYYEGTVDFASPWASERSRLMLSLGGATTHRTVTATMPDFSIDSSNTVTGVTASAGIAVPYTPSIDFTGQFRYVNVPSATYLIPGPADISGNQFIFTAGATMHFRSGFRY